MLASACATEPHTPEMGPVGYAPVIASTCNRTNASQNIYPNDVPFGVWVGALYEDKLWETAADESRVFIENEQVAWDGQKWNTATDHLWPSDASLSQRPRQSSRFATVWSFTTSTSSSRATTS